MVKVGDYVKILEYNDEEDYNGAEIEQIANVIIGKIVKILAIPVSPGSWYKVEVPEFQMDGDDGERIWVNEVFLLRDWFIVV